MDHGYVFCKMLFNESFATIIITLQCQSGGHKLSIVTPVNLANILHAFPQSFLFKKIWNKKGYLVAIFFQHHFTVWHWKGSVIFQMTVVKMTAFLDDAVFSPANINRRFKTPAQWNCNLIRY